MVGHRSQSGSEVIRKEYALLDGDLTNPVMHHILQGIVTFFFFQVFVSHSPTRA